MSQRALKLSPDGFLWDLKRLSVHVVTIFVFSDFDDDGTLDFGDLENLVNCLTGETEDTRLTPDEMKQLIHNVSSWASVLCGLFGSSPDSKNVLFSCFLDS